jgi:hypothetical protein
MRLDEIPHTLFPVQPPPLWYVTNGELTVGPVVTGLLMRGVEHGRVPDYCHVRPYRGNWRELLRVREIAAMHRKIDAQASKAQIGEWQRALARVRDEDELCHTLTWISMLATSAESGMFHYRGRSPRTLVTRAVVGPLPKDRLGYALPEEDLLLRSARKGRPVTGPPYGATEDALAMRFAYSRGGAGAVAMIPIFSGGVLTAMLELSRPGHAFRRADLQAAERLAQRALFQRAN